MTSWLRWTFLALALLLGLAVLWSCEDDAMLGLSTPCDQHPCSDNLDPVSK
jgi:hypothetical protein